MDEGVYRGREGDVAAGNDVKATPVVEEATTLDEVDEDMMVPEE